MFESNVMCSKFFTDRQIVSSMPLFVTSKPVGFENTRVQFKGHVVSLKLSARGINVIRWPRTVASLRLVPPGAVTDGVTLIFTSKKWWTFLVVITPTFSAFSRWSFVQCSPLPQSLAAHLSLHSVCLSVCLSVFFTGLTMVIQSPRSDSPDCL